MLRFLLRFSWIFLLLPVGLQLPAWASVPAPVPREGGKLRAISGRELVDRVVATVAPPGGRGYRIILTLSDLELETRVALIQRGATGVAESALPEDTLSASLDWLIAEHLLYAEAEQLGLAAVEGEEIETAIEAMRSHFPAPTAFERFVQGLDLGEELPRILRRRIVVDRYLASRLRLGGRVSEAEVRSAWEQRQGELGSMSLEEARAPLRASLEKEQREARVKALVSDLRSRAEVRILHRFRDGSP